MNFCICLRYCFLEIHLNNRSVIRLQSILFGIRDMKVKQQPVRQIC